MTARMHGYVDADAGVYGDVYVDVDVDVCV